jgi:hypothetical protein
MIAMIKDSKQSLTSTRLLNAVLLLLLVVAAIVVFLNGRTAAETPTESPCACHTLATHSENFDDLTPPALPPDWFATNLLGPPPLWVTSNAGVPSPPADTQPNAAFVDDPAVLSDKRLDSLVLSFFETGPPTLTFRHNFNLEASDTDPNVGFDGAVLEMSTDNGNSFQDVLVAGGTFGEGGYNRTISTDRGSPIAGRQAWSGNSGGFITTVVHVPSASPFTRFRWRMASDNTGSGEGWRVDTVTISYCPIFPLCTPKPIPTPRSRPTPAPRP